MSRRALLKSLEVFSDLRQCFEKQFFFARVGPVAEGAARQEVSLDITEAALHARRAVGITDGVSLKAEAVTLGESGHFRHRHHVAARAFQHHQVSVVDQASFAGPLKILESVSEKDLALETAEGGKELKEEHARITADQRGGLNRPQLAADLGAVRRGVVLHLLAGLEVIFSDGFFRFVADALPPAKGRQRLIRERSA